jgi:hypothetical protein
VKNRVYLILLALAGSNLTVSASPRAVQRLSDGRTRLWPASLHGTLDERTESGLIAAWPDWRARGKASDHDRF